MYSLKLKAGWSGWNIANRRNLIGGWSMVVLCCCLVFLMGSCQQEDLIDKDIDAESISADQQEILDYFAAQSYDLEMVRFQDKMVIYSYAAWETENFLKTIRGEYTAEMSEDAGNNPVVAADRQRGILSEFRMHAIIKENVKDIRYFIRPSVREDCGNNWVDAIEEAAQEWTDITKCKVTMFRTGDEEKANLIFASDEDNDIPEGMMNIPNGAFGVGLASRDGEVGSFTVINGTFRLAPRKKMMAMKLIGVNLGFLPTNGDEGERIPNTPKEERGSIHNLTASQTTPGFKSGDIYAARVYYPQGMAIPEIIHINSAKPGWLNLGYLNPAPANHPYYYIALYISDTNGNELSRHYFESAPTTAGIDGIDLRNITPGIYQVEVRGCNFRRDSFSAKSEMVTVDLR